MHGRYGSYDLVDHTASHPPLALPSRRLVSVDNTLVGAYTAEEAGIEAAGDIAGFDGIAAVAEDVIGEAFGEISNLVDAVCQIMSILHAMHLVAIAPI